MSGGEVSWRSYQRGKRSATQRVGPGWKTRPARAASWCAAKTIVSAAAGSPSSATTLWVVRCGSTRRNQCRPPETSSAIAAALTSPAATAGARPPRASPAAAPARLSSPRGSANEPTARSASIRAGSPSAANRSRIQAAAARSPGEADGRSIRSRRSTVARRRAGSAGMAAAG